MTMPNDKQSRAELVERLRGIYRIPITDGLGAVGSGDEPDNPNEFVRSFETSPIMREAASAIEALEAENARLREASLHPSGDGDVAFVEWLRNWSKKRFGKWITHSTARGALSELRSTLNPEREEK